MHHAATEATPMAPVPSHSGAATGRLAARYRAEREEKRS